MSWEASAWAMKQKLPCVSKMLLIALSDHHNKITGQCNPSMKLLAEEAGLSISAANKHIAILAKSELITIVVGKRPDGSRTSSHYTLNIEATTLKVEAPTSEVDQEPGIEPGDAPVVPSSDSSESFSVTPGDIYSPKNEIQEWYDILQKTKPFTEDWFEAEACRVKYDITPELALQKAFEVQAWWLTAPPKTKKEGNPFFHWRNWCTRELKHAASDSSTSRPVGPREKQRLAELRDQPAPRTGSGGNDGPN